MPSLHWKFYLPDGDRSTGWDNHGYVLQYVCEGYGGDPAGAWQFALDHGLVPDAFQLPDDLVAIRQDAVHKIHVPHPDQTTLEV